MPQAMIRTHNNNVHANGHTAHNGLNSGQNGHMYSGQNGGFSVSSGLVGHGGLANGNFTHNFNNHSHHNGHVSHYLQNGHAKTNGYIGKCK